MFYVNKYIIVIVKQNVVNTRATQKATKCHIFINFSLSLNSYFHTYDEYTFFTAQGNTRYRNETHE